MKSLSPDHATANYYLSATGFAFPLFSVAGCALFQGSIGVFGLGLCFLASPFAFGALFFKLPFPIKHALASFLVGYIIAVGFFVLGAYINLSGQQSPWLN